MPLSLNELKSYTTMLPVLAKANGALDKAVDLCYPQTFPNKTNLIEFFFELYDQYTAGLFEEKK